MQFAKKSLGQNFLIDLNIKKKIINLTNLFNKNVLEIGPGKGALTDEIIKKKPKSLILIEKDKNLSKKLKIKYAESKIIKVLNEDILKYSLEKKLKENSIIFGNLPYNISSRILVKMIKFKKWPPKYSALIFMFQKELADKIVGQFKTKQYGRLSILTNYRLSAIDKFNVSRHCFFPKPKIESTLIYLKPHNKMSKNIKNIDNLEKITNILFSNKRKMINKNLKKIFKDIKHINLIKSLNLKARPSDLSPETYYEITRLFEEIN